MAIEGENLGTATIYLTVDKSSMDATIGKAKLELAGMGAEASKQYEAMSVGQRKMAESMVRQAESIGKTRAEQIAYNAQLKIGGALGDEIAAKAIANANAISGAQQASAAAATAAADKFAVSAEERAAQEARFAAVMAAERAKAVEAEAARAAAAEARAATVSEADAAEFAAFNATVRAKQALMLQLNAAMASGLTTQREISAAEDALDAAMAGRALTQKEQLTYFAALDAAESRLAKQRLASADTINVETVSLDANTAALKLNSRTQYEIGVLAGEIASGNASRVKRSVPALLNASGLTTKLMSPAGLGVVGGAASIGALVISYVQAVKEANNFTRAIYATGQQGVITADQMEVLAGKVGDSTGSYSDAAKALDLLVSSGKYASDEYETLTRALVNFQNVTGGSLQEGLQAIDSLNGQVGDGLVKLNSQYHFLTDTVYEQIAALQAQGQTEQARDLERKAFADGINQSADDIKSHLDPLAKAWDAVGAAASSAWHAMGRDVRAQANATITSIQTYFSDLGDLIDRLKHPMATVMNGGLSPQEAAAGGSNDSAQKAALDKQATQTLAEFGVESAKFRSAAQKRADEIVDVVNRTNAAIAKAMAAGNKDLADRIRASGASLAEAIATKGVEAPKAPKAGGKTSADYVAAAQDLLAKMTERNVKATMDAAGADAKAAVIAGQFAETLEQQVAARKNAIDIQIASVGMGQKEAAQLQQLNDLEQQRIRQVQQLQRQQVTHPEQYAELQRQIDAVNAAYKDMRDTMLDGFSRMDVAQADWHNGLTAALQDFLDRAGDVAGQAQAAFTNLFDGMADSVGNFVKTSKFNLEDLARSFLADVARMEAAAAESAIIGWLANAFSGVADNGSAGYASYATATSGNTAVGIGSANGNVFRGPGIAAYENQIVSKPTFFASGANVMGEAGPEAIMPLTRGSDGKLGVKASGGGGNTTVIVENHSDSKAEVQQSKDSGGNDLIKVIVGKAVGEVDKRIARGGSTGQIIQQTFGLSRRGIPVAG